MAQRFCRSSAADSGPRAVAGLVVSQTVNSISSGRLDSKRVSLRSTGKRVSRVVPTSVMDVAGSQGAGRSERAAPS